MDQRENPLFGEPEPENPLLGQPAQHINPLLGDQPPDPIVDLEKISSPAELARARRNAQRLMRDQRRTPNAHAALAEWTKEVSVYGFTKGQFSLIQLITAALERTGPAELVLSTWTAAHQDVTEVLSFCESGLVTSARWLVDLTFSRRSPQLAQRIRQVFGDDAIRVAKNHAKFAMLGNADWQVVIHTSMNLNHNPRFENFEIAHDPELYAFHAQIIDEVWRKQGRHVEGLRPGEVGRHFRDEL